MLSRLTEWRGLAEWLVGVDSSLGGHWGSREESVHALNQSLPSEGVTLDDLYGIILGRHAEAAMLAKPILNSAMPVLRPAELMYELLGSVEFARRACRESALARPDLPRVFYAHVPRTAGTWILDGFESYGRCLVIRGSQTASGWLEHSQRIEWSVNVLRKFLNPDLEFFVFSGHEGLLAYDGLLRARDDVFTTIRQPIDIHVSMANYMLSVAWENPTRLDGRVWLQRLKEGFPDAEVRVERLTPEHAWYLLRHPQQAIDYREVVLRSLAGDSGPRSINGALETLTSRGCKVLQRESVEEFLQPYGVQFRSEPVNGSYGFLKVTDLGLYERALIHDVLVGRDQSMYDLLSRMASDELRIR